MTARGANLLGALVTGLGDRMAAAVAPPGRRGGQTPAALAVLAQQEGLGIEQLRIQLGLSQPATVRLVDDLAASGLARRAPGADRRSIRVELTDEGRAAAAAVLERRRALLDEAMRPLGDADQRELERLLEIMLEGMTGSRVEAELICRLCDYETCPEQTCPVECAVSE